MGDEAAYTIKIWLTSILMGPVLILAYLFLSDEPMDSVALIGLFIVFGWIFSIPAFLLLLVSNIFIFKKIQKESQIKILNQVLVIIFCVATFMIILSTRSLESLIESLIIQIPYILSLSFSVWFYRIKDLPAT